MAACSKMWGETQAPYRRACNYPRWVLSLVTLSASKAGSGLVFMGLRRQFHPSISNSQPRCLHLLQVCPPHFFINSPLCQIELTCGDTCHNMSQADRQSFHGGYCSATEHNRLTHCLSSSTSLGRKNWYKMPGSRSNMMRVRTL